MAAGRSNPTAKGKAKGKNSQEKEQVGLTQNDEKLAHSHEEESDNKPAVADEETTGSLNQDTGDSKDINMDKKGKGKGKGKSTHQEIVAQDIDEEEEQEQDGYASSEPSNDVSNNNNTESYSSSSSVIKSVQDRQKRLDQLKLLRVKIYVLELETDEESNMRYCIL